MRSTRPSARLSIPKIIHHTWIGDDPLPDAERDMMEKWRHYHPEWEMRLWTRDNLPPMQNRALYDSRKNTGHRADILRYELMHQFGGVYADMDMECQKPIDDLIVGCEGFGGHIKPTMVDTGIQYMEIAILGSIPGHPLFRRVIDMLPDWFSAHESAGVEIRTGPQFFQAQYKAWRDDWEQYRGEHRDFILFKPSLFFPYTWKERERGWEDFPDAYAVHRWWCSWMNKGDT